MKALDNQKLKTIVIYGAMAFLALLVVISIWLGNRNEESVNPSDVEQTEENSTETELSRSVDDIYVYDDGEDAEETVEEPTPTNEELEQLKEGELWESLEPPVDEPDLSEIDMFTDEGPSSYEDLLTDEQINQSQNIGREFIEMVYNMDGNEPMKYYEEAEHLMSEELFNRLEQEYADGKMAWTYGLKRDFDSLEIYQPSSIDPSQEDGITWAIRVKGTQSFHGNEEKEVMDIYILLVKEEEGEYIVEDFVINLPT